MVGRIGVTGILMAAIAAGYVGSSMSQAKARTTASRSTPVTREAVRARRFELVDAGGKVKGSLALGSGGPYLSLCDAAGRTRGAFAVVNGGIALVLKDSVGTGRVVFGSTAEGTGVTLLDAAGRLRGMLAVAEGGAPGLAAYGSSERIRGMLGVSEDAAVLVLADSEGETVWSAP